MTMRLAELQRRGARLLGRLQRCTGSGDHARLQFADAGSVRRAAADADRFLLAFVAQVDAHCIEVEAALDASPPPPRDAADEALICESKAAIAAADAAAGVGATAADAAPVAVADIPVAELGCVLWATGFNFDFSWLEGFDPSGQGPRLLDAAGYPVTRGEDGSSAAVKGLYFCGLNWMNRRKSGILLGVAGDASQVAASIVQQVGGRNARL